MRWFFDMSEAARHPWKACTAVFVLGWMCFAPFAYLRWVTSVGVSVAVGAGFGSLLGATVLGKIAQIRHWPTWFVRRTGNPVRLPIGGDLLWVGAGVGVVLAGLSRGSLQLALIGLPLIALGAVWYLIKRDVGS